MCTVTWWRGDDAYGVCFNRDESRARSPSLPVAPGRSDSGASYLSPRDPDGGGTWLMANEYGLVAGVLNWYEAAGALPPGRRTRGSLPLACAACRSVAEAGTVLQTLNWEDFAPFVFLVWDRAAEVSWTWNGTRLQLEPKPRPPVATSSYQTPQVLDWRRQRFRELVGGPGPDPDSDSGMNSRSTPLDRLRRYHYDATHPDGAYNVRMRRADARTESICFLTVNAREVRFWHQREAPDTLAAVDEHEAALTRSGA